jgi:hypothetical protein
MNFVLQHCVCSLLTACCSRLRQALDSALIGGSLAFCGDSGATFLIGGSVRSMPSRAESVLAKSGNQS